MTQLGILLSQVYVWHMSDILQHVMIDVVYAKFIPDMSLKFKLGPLAGPPQQKCACSGPQGLDCHGIIARVFIVQHKMRRCHWASVGPSQDGPQRTQVANLKSRHRRRSGLQRWGCAVAADGAATSGVVAPPPPPPDSDAVVAGASDRRQVAPTMTFD
jgi:hypothetical protein